MKERIQISINPTYNCNLNCSFCYLNHSGHLMNLDTLKNKLNEISKDYDIESIDIFGGEICLLPDAYLMKLILICKEYVENIGVITNYTIDKDWLFNREDIDLSVSWDYIFREFNEEVFEKIKNTKRKLGIILTSPELYDKKYEVVEKLNQLDGDYYIDIKPCMPTKDNNVKYDFKKYQEFVLFIMSHCKHKSINYMNLQNPPKNLFTPHIFINPYCKTQKIKITEKGEEFETVDTFESKIPEQCKSCPYIDKCQTEHDCFVEDDYDCIGMKHLIEIQEKLNGCKTNNYNKRRQISYFKNKKDYGDTHLEYVEMNMPNDMLYNVIIEFFETKSDLLYPAKSYYVAIVYAWLMNKYFGEDIKKALDDDGLLNYDDKFFVKYSDNKELYDKLLDTVVEKLDKGLYDESIKSTVSYFNKEFLIND